ncbi:uncharacterized protein [Apostichopus japonicus]|uniref:uncharacterized protein n=1 Tax=Stichopus japonicus TaxID=307972 RepID=UPI003AB769C7
MDTRGSKSGNATPQMKRMLKPLHPLVGNGNFQKKKGVPVVRDPILSGSPIIGPPAVSPSTSTIDMESEIVWVGGQTRPHRSPRFSSKFKDDINGPSRDSEIASFLQNSPLASDGDIKPERDVMTYLPSLPMASCTSPKKKTKKTKKSKKQDEYDPIMALLGGLSEEQTTKAEEKVSHSGLTKQPLMRKSLAPSVRRPDEPLDSSQTANSTTDASQKSYLHLKPIDSLRPVRELHATSKDDMTKAPFLQSPLKPIGLSQLAKRPVTGKPTATSAQSIMEHMHGKSPKQLAPIEHATIQHQQVKPETPADHNDSLCEWFSHPISSPPETRTRQKTSDFDDDFLEEDSDNQQHLDVNSRMNLEASLENLHFSLSHTSDEVNTDGELHLTSCGNDSEVSAKSPSPMTNRDVQQQWIPLVPTDKETIQEFPLQPEVSPTLKSGQMETTDFFDMDSADESQESRQMDLEASLENLHFTLSETSDTSEKCANSDCLVSRRSGGMAEARSLNLQQTKSLEESNRANTDDCAQLTTSDTDLSDGAMEALVSGELSDLSNYTWSSDSDQSKSEGPKMECQDHEDAAQRTSTSSTDDYSGSWTDSSTSSEQEEKEDESQANHKNEEERLSIILEGSEETSSSDETSYTSQSDSRNDGKDNDPINNASQKYDEEASSGLSTIPEETEESSTIAFSSEPAVSEGKDMKIFTMETDQTIKEPHNDKAEYGTEDVSKSQDEDDDSIPEEILIEEPSEENDDTFQSRSDQWVDGFLNSLDKESENTNVAKRVKPDPTESTVSFNRQKLDESKETMNDRKVKTAFSCKPVVSEGKDKEIFTMQSEQTIKKPHYDKAEYGTEDVSKSQDEGDESIPEEILIEETSEEDEDSFQSRSDQWVDSFLTYLDKESNDKTTNVAKPDPTESKVSSSRQKLDESEDSKSDIKVKTEVKLESMWANLGQSLEMDAQLMVEQLLEVEQCEQEEANSNQDFQTTDSDIVRDLSSYVTPEDYSVGLRGDSTYSGITDEYIGFITPTNLEEESILEQVAAANTIQPGGVTMLQSTLNGGDEQVTKDGQMSLPVPDQNNGSRSARGSSQVLNGKDSMTCTPVMTEIKSCEDHIKVRRDRKNKSSSSSRCDDSLNSCLSTDDCNKSRPSERNGKGSASSKSHRVPTSPSCHLESVSVNVSASSYSQQQDILSNSLHDIPPTPKVELSVKTSETEENQLTDESQTISQITPPEEKSPQENLPLVAENICQRSCKLSKEHDRMQIHRSPPTIQPEDGLIKKDGETKVDTATTSLRPTTQIAPLTMDNLLTKSLETSLKEKIALKSAAGHDWLIETNLRLAEGYFPCIPDEIILNGYKSNLQTHDNTKSANNVIKEHDQPEMQQQVQTVKSISCEALEDRGKDQQNGKTTDTVDDVDAVLIDGQADEQKCSTSTLQIHDSLKEHEQPEKNQQVQQDTESLQEREEEEQNATVIDRVNDVDAAMDTDGRSDEQLCSTDILRIHDSNKYTNHIEEHDQPETHRRVHPDEQVSCESFEEQEMDTPKETSTDAALDIDDEMIFDCTTVEQTCTMQTSRTTDTKSYREYEQNERPQTLKSNSSEPTTPREQSNTIPSPVLATFGLTGVPQDIMLDIPKLCRQLSGERRRDNSVESSTSSGLETGAFTNSLDQRASASHQNVYQVTDHQEVSDHKLQTAKEEITRLREFNKENMEAKTFLTCELERYVTDISNLKSEHRREMKQEREKVQKLEEKVIGLMREMREQQAQSQLQMNTMRCRYRYNERELRNELAAADEKIDRMKMNPELQRDETILNLRAENEELKKATERMRKEFNVAKVEGLAMEMAIEDWKNEYQKLTSTVTTIKEEAKQVKEMMQMRKAREQPNGDGKVLDIETAIESSKQGKENIECKIMKALKTGLDAMMEENQQFKKDMIAKDEKRKQEVSILEAQLKESKKCNKQLQDKLTDTQRDLRDRLTTLEYRMKNSTDLESKVMKLANKQDLMDCMALQRDSRIEDHEREHKVQLGRLEDQLKLERTSNTKLRKDRDNLLQRVAKLERHPNFIDGDNGRGMPRPSHEMPKSKSCLRDQDMEVKMLPQKLEEANQKLPDKTKCDEGRDARICALECGMSQLLQGTTEKKTFGFPTQPGRKDALLMQLQRNNDDRAAIEQELQILLNIQEQEAEASMMKEDMINCLKNQVGVLQYNLMTNDEELYATKLLAVQQSRTIEDLRTSNQVNRERTDTMDDGEQVEVR